MAAIISACIGLVVKNLLSFLGIFLSLVIYESVCLSVFIISLFALHSVVFKVRLD